jgi:hypothetical protein
VIGAAAMMTVHMKRCMFHVVSLAARSAMQGFPSAGERLEACFFRAWATYEFRLVPHARSSARR